MKKNVVNESAVIRKDTRGVMFVELDAWGHPDEDGMREATCYEPVGFLSAFVVDERVNVMPSGPLTERGPRRVVLYRVPDDGHFETWCESLRVAEDDDLDEIEIEETIAEGDLISGKLADVLVLQQKNERLRAKADLLHQKTDATRRDRANDLFEKLLPIIVPLVERTFPSSLGGSMVAPYVSRLSDLKDSVPSVLFAAFNGFMVEVTETQLSKLRTSGLMSEGQVRALQFAHDFMILDRPITLPASADPSPPIVTPPPANGAGERAGRPASQQEEAS